jgi:hypothetical protein
VHGSYPLIKLTLSAYHLVLAVRVPRPTNKKIEEITHATYPALIAFGGFSLSGDAALVLAGCGESFAREAAPQASARAISSAGVVGQSVVEIQTLSARIEAVGLTLP